MSNKLCVERIGGLAGFGLPQSHLKSEGTIALEALPPNDRRTIEAHFDGSQRASPVEGDAFLYKITRQTSGGLQTINLSEQDAPESIRNIVRDVIR